MTIFSISEIVAESREFDAALADFQRRIEAAGLSCCDCSDVVLGDADIENVTWIPTVIPEAPKYALPGTAVTAARAALARVQGGA